jgi:hypothetical protein
MNGFRDAGYCCDVDGPEEEVATDTRERRIRG